MSVNVDGETEKAVDSIIERLLAVRISPPDPCRPDLTPTSFALKQDTCCGAAHESSPDSLSDALGLWSAGAGEQAGQGTQPST
jgi:hypothetical protein